MSNSTLEKCTNAVEILESEGMKEGQEEKMKDVLYIMKGTEEKEQRRTEKYYKASFTDLCVSSKCVNVA